VRQLQALLGPKNLCLHTYITYGDTTNPTGEYNFRSNKAQRGLSKGKGLRESRRPWGLARAPLALILKSKQLPNVLLSPAYCTHSDVLTRLTNMDMHFGTLTLTLTLTKTMATTGRMALRISVASSEF